MRACFLIDNNHLREVINPVSQFRERVYQAIKRGNRFGTCYPVLCELEVGIRNTKFQADNRRRLRQFLNYVRIWPMDMLTVGHYGELFGRLAKAGRPNSFVDILLAAFAKQMDLTILTTDGDFKALPEIRTENWLA